jgi:regulator of PEP synthase PpsR (kinase-PPPase family)
MGDGNKPYQIYIVSDGTGRTAEQAITAALYQFSDVNVKLIKKAPVRTEQKIRKVVQEAEKNGGFIVHTLVTDKLRDVMLHSGRKYNVDTIDLLGGLLRRLSEKFAVSPAEKPGLFFPGMVCSKCSYSNW